MEIVNEYISYFYSVEHTSGWHEAPIIFGIIGVALFIKCLVIIGEYIKSNKFQPSYIFIVLMTIFVIGMAFFAYHTKFIVLEIPTYQIIVDEETTFQEVVDKYEIIDVSGKLVTVRDHDWDINVDYKIGNNGEVDKKR